MRSGKAAMEGATDGAPVETRLRDLRETDTPVSVVARVVRAERRQVTRKSDGTRRAVLSGLLSDGTATVRFTWWEPPSEEIERGTVLRIANATVRLYRGIPELSLGWRSRVAPAHPSELPEVAPEELVERKLLELKPGDEGFRVDARVLEVSAREVTVGEERRRVHSGLLGDRSGVRSFTAWSDLGLAEGSAVRITGAYVRSFRGQGELTLDERSRVERIMDDLVPSAETLRATPVRSIAAVEEAGGGARVRVEGIVVALLPPSGVVLRCPQCRRATQQGLCRLHGAVEGVPDLRARLVLDDGTGALTVNAARPETERLSRRTLAECLERLKAQPDPSVLEAELADQLFGLRLGVMGRASRDDFGVTLYPERVDVIAPSADAIAELLREERSG